MKVIILTRENQRKILEKAAKFSCDTKYSFSIFTSAFEFQKRICQKKHKEIFLILADCSYFQPDKANPYTTFSSKGKNIPLCIYNDPFPKKTKRAAFWLSKIYTYCSNFLDPWKFQELSEFFIRLEYFFQIPEVEKQISVICNPQKKVKKITIQKQINDFENPLCRSRVRLFEFFMNNFEKEVSADEIMDFMWKDSVGKKINSLYAYINDLRNFLKTSEFSSFELIHTTKGKYMLRHEILA